MDELRFDYKGIIKKDGNIVDQIVRNVFDIPVDRLRNKQIKRIAKIVKMSIPIVATIGAAYFFVYERRQKEEEELNRRRLRSE